MLQCRPTLGDLSAQEFSPPEICHPRQKKSLMPGGQPKGEAGRSWNWLMHNTRKLLLYHLRKRIHVMNKRVRWSYVYCTLDIDGPWFWSTDIKVLFLFERRIFSVGNVNFFPFVTAVSVFAWIVMRYCGILALPVCGIVVFVPPLRPPLI